MLSPTFESTFPPSRIETEAEQDNAGVGFSKDVELSNTSFRNKSALKTKDDHEPRRGGEPVRFTELQTISNKDISGSDANNIFESAANGQDLTSNFAVVSFFEDEIEDRIPELDSCKPKECGHPSNIMKPVEDNQPKFGLEATDLLDHPLNRTTVTSYNSDDSASVTRGTSDCLFDVFNLEDFILDERTRRGSVPMVSKALEEQNESYRADLKEYLPGGTIDRDVTDEQYFLQSTATRDQRTPCTGIQPFVVSHAQTTAGSHHSFQSQSFIDLLKSEGSQLNLGFQQKPLFSTSLKKRDYSLSSDSGVGSSILEFAASPKDSSPTSSAGESNSVSPESTSGNGYNAIECRQRASNLVDLSTRDEANLGKSDSVGEVSRVKIVLAEEKVSSKKTAYNEKWGVKVLKAWCIEMSINEDFESSPPDKLNELLCRFWSEVRKTNGDYYGRNSLFNLRAMINKHLKGKPFCASFDIVTDERFRSSNETLDKQLKILKGIGKTITHKEPISELDIRKMYEMKVLGTDNPLSLLRKVWFEITLYFCHKGSEPQEKLTRRSLEFCKDEKYRTYVAKPGSRNDVEAARMYETGGKLCPVSSYRLYLQKLHPQQGRLFQQARRKSTPSSPMWYGKAPIGEKALQQMMASISVAAELSKRYTNHCVRTTAIDRFVAVRDELDGLGTVEKSTHKAKIHGTAVKENSYTPSYIPHNLRYGEHQAGCYGNPASSHVVPYTCQRPRQQDQSHAYSYEMYGQNAQTFPRQRTPFPQVPHNPIGTQIDPCRRAYKRPASRATSMTCRWSDGQINYNDGQPTYETPRKRPRVDNSSGFLSPIQGGNDLTCTTTVLYTEQCSTNSSTNQEEFSETIIYDGGVPEIKSITNQNFTLLTDNINY